MPHSAVASDPATREWHLDKRIPIATIIAILGQAAALGWIASNMNARITYLEKISSDKNTIEGATHVAERMAVMEANQKNFIQQIDKIDHKLDVISEKLNVTGGR